MIRSSHFAAPLAAAALLLACACSPSPPPAPATPAAPPVQPATTTAAASVAATGWQSIVAAAHSEGKLVLSTHAGAGYERFVEEVRKALPDLTIEATTMKASDFTARVVVEQQNGQYLWDVHEGPVSNVYTVLTPAGGVQPIKPFLEALPTDVKDDSKWAGGFELYTDPKNPVSFIYEYSDIGGLYVNREQVTDGIATMDDLLDPKYKGKVAVYEPTVSNGGSMSLTNLVAVKGDDFLKRLLIENDARFISTSRQLTEFVAQGRYPIGFGLDATQLADLQKQGVGTSVERNRAIGRYSLASGVSVLKNAPHPNAAKVYLSWALSKEGQTAWAQYASVDSSTRRLDVPTFHPDSAPDYGHPENYPVIQGTARGGDVLDRTLTIAKSK
ncbi:MAG: hypothetical protein NVSMB2_00960 [Chloroflexota bacterium]